MIAGMRDQSAIALEERVVALSIVERDGRALVSMPTHYMHDREFILAALRSEPFIFIGPGVRVFREDREIMLRIGVFAPWAIEMVDCPFLDDREFLADLADEHVRVYPAMVTGPPAVGRCCWCLGDENLTVEEFWVNQSHRQAARRDLVAG